MKINRKTTAGPPAALALPMVLKIPAPIMAAIPKEVISRNDNVLFSLCSLSW